MSRRRRVYQVMALLVGSWVASRIALAQHRSPFAVTETWTLPEARQRAERINQRRYKQWRTLAGDGATRITGDEVKALLAVTKHRGKIRPTIDNFYVTITDEEGKYDVYLEEKEVVIEVKKQPRTYIGPPYRVLPGYAVVPADVAMYYVVDKETLKVERAIVRQ
jgi:hypothetical protein